jgi:hypothetical protein
MKILKGRGAPPRAAAAVIKSYLGEVMVLEQAKVDEDFVSPRWFLGSAPNICISWFCTAANKTASVLSIRGPKSNSVTGRII